MDNLGIFWVESDLNSFCFLSYAFTENYWQIVLWCDKFCFAKDFFAFPIFQRLIFFVALVLSSRLKNSERDPEPSICLQTTRRWELSTTLQRPSHISMTKSSRKSMWSKSEKISWTPCNTKIIMHSKFKAYNDELTTDKYMTLIKYIRLK